MLPSALQPLAAWPHFIAWRLEWNNERSKWDKIPYSPRGYKASSTNPGDWGTYEQAQAYATAANMAGVGFVFSERDPFWFLDIDGAWDGKQWSQLAQEMLVRLPGAAVEVSQSGTGLHIIGTGTAPEGHANRNIPLHLEFYTRERFVALTGTHATGSASVDLTGPVAGVVGQYFQRAAGADGAPIGWTTEPVPEWRGPADDGELLERAFATAQRSAAGVFGLEGVTFSDLFMANAAVLGAKWPPENPGDQFNHSSADQALANQLAFWTGKNCERMERIMRMSALARPKWDERSDYLPGTITKAVGFIRGIYQERQAADAVPPPPPPEPAAIEEAGFHPREGGAMMLYQTQLEHFAGCIYITSLNKVLTPSGDRLDQARFDVIYGGHEFVITTDGKKTSNSAWEAFTRNLAFAPPTADKLCFRPEIGSGGIVREAGKVLANFYVTPEVEATPGDASPFLDLMSRQLPNPDDRAQLLTYMASVIQNPGLKAQWWPVLQGGEGNGKSYYLMIMAFCVGKHYAHMPNTTKMIKQGMNFNGWIDGRLFLGLEEVRAVNRREFFEEFKTTVTNPMLPVEAKGVEEVTADNRANGIITTNFKDGVPITGKNRRYAPFFMAQQSKEDRFRDGLDDRYFLDFKQWMNGTGTYAAHGPEYGYRVINHYLRTFPLAAELDPNQLCITAPVTSSTVDAIVQGRGRAEQDIVEAIEEERPGFAGGWVSSVKLNDLLEQRRYSVPVNQRREMMQSLGYDYHPALANLSIPGRVTSVVAPDNGKPRLYIRNGHVSANIETPPEVARAYSDAQLKAASDKSPAAQTFNK